MMVDYIVWEEEDLIVIFGVCQIVYQEGEELMFDEGEIMGSIFCVLFIKIVKL